MEEQITFSAFNLDNYLSQLGTASSGHTSLSLFKELIDNSIDASATSIELSYIERENTEKIIIYKDTGTGMDKESLFNSVQFYSKNSNGGIGKFGIGGSSTLVNWCDITNTHTNKSLSIISKTPDGTVRSISVNWDNCNSIEDFNNEVNSSFTVDNHKYITMMESYSHGSIFYISTSPEKFDEIKAVHTPMDIYMDLGQTYKYYIEKGLTITVFGEQIKFFSIINPLLSETINIDLYKNAKNVAYSAIIGKTRLSFTHGKTKKLKKIDFEDIEDNWTFSSQLKLKLTFGNNIYSGKEKSHEERSAKQLSIENCVGFREFCTEEGVEDNSEIKLVANSYIKDLYICRISNGNSIYKDKGRILGSLELDSPTRFAADDIALICTHKELVFNAKDDNKIGLVQQNKSVIEWTNTPKDLKEFIQKVSNKWIRERLSKKFDGIDTIAQKERERNSPIILFIHRHIERLLRNNDSIFKLGDQDDLNLASNIIKRNIKSFITSKKEKHRVNATIIQKWFKSLKTLQSIPTTGFIKFQKFCLWAHYHHNITIIQKWWKCILFNRNIICYRNKQYKSAKIIQTCWRNYIIQRDNLARKSNASIIIQTKWRQYYATKILNEERKREKEFNNLISRFNIQLPTKRNQFILFKQQFIQFLSLLEQTM